MSLLVQKYGGSSLATPRHIRGVAQRIKDAKSQGHDLVVVVSAMGHTTDHLIRLARKTVSRPAERELDMLVTAGERVSMSLLAMALHELGVSAISFTGSQSGIVTTSEHTEARIVEIRPHRIHEALPKGQVVIVAGFQGVSREKEITTLGRGGSDTSAVAIAAALGADRCEIFTDVDGLFTADPRRVEAPRLISHCSYDEAIELASLGAKLHARSMEVAKRFNVKVRMAPSHRPQITGTWFGTFNLSVENEMESPSIRGIATKEGFDCFTIEGEVGPVIKALQAIVAPLRFFQSLGSRTRFLCEKEKSDAVSSELKKSGISFEVLPKVGIVSAVGEGISHSEGVMGFLSALESSDTQILLISSNALSVTAAVPSSDLSRVAGVIHDRLVGLQKKTGVPLECETPEVLRPGV